jgi:hypothetical protein
MAAGDPTAYMALKQLDCFEFWTVFDHWYKAKQEKNEQLKQQKRLHNGRK